MKTCSFGFMILLVLASGFTYAGTELEDYVFSSDNTFEYRLVNTEQRLLYTTYVLEITSQTWREDEIYPEVWEHWLTIVEPRFSLFEGLLQFSLVKTDKAFLKIIRGDADHEDEPDSVGTDLLNLALRNRAVVAELHGIPIGPVAFYDEQEEPDWWDDLNPFYDEEDDLVLREEDSFLARSFDLALTTGDNTWAAVFPMVKAVVAGMDVCQDFLKQKNFGNNVVDEFVVQGHSKRGWTSLLTAIVDDRVIAAAPLGYDILNTAEQAALIDSSWDNSGEALQDYEEFDILDRFQTEEGRRLLEEIDAYYFGDFLNIPILVCVGTGDAGSVVDSINLYLDDLPGNVHIHYDPNKGHDIRNASGTLNAVSALFRKTVENRSLPDFSYAFASDGSFAISDITQTPVSVKLWTATNPSKRDFREGQVPPIPWSSSSDVITREADGSWSGKVPQPPEGGYTAFYIELNFKDGDKNLDNSYSLATPVKVLGEIK